MIGFIVLMLLPITAYCLVQTWRDQRRRAWPMAIWGGVTSAYLVWLLYQLLTSNAY